MIGKSLISSITHEFTNAIHVNLNQWLQPNDLSTVKNTNTVANVLFKWKRLVPMGGCGQSWMQWSWCLEVGP